MTQVWPMRAQGVVQEWNNQPAESRVFTAPCLGTALALLACAMRDLVFPVELTVPDTDYYADGRRRRKMSLAAQAGDDSAIRWFAESERPSSDIGRATTQLAPEPMLAASNGRLALAPPPSQRAPSPSRLALVAPPIPTTAPVRPVPAIAQAALSTMLMNPMPSEPVPALASRELKMALGTNAPPMQPVPRGLGPSAASVMSSAPMVAQPSAAHMVTGPDFVSFPDSRLVASNTSSELSVAEVCKGAGLLAIALALSLLFSQLLRGVVVPVEALLLFPLGLSAITAVWPTHKGTTANAWLVPLSASVGVVLLARGDWKHITLLYACLAATVIARRLRQ